MFVMYKCKEGNSDNKRYLIADISEYKCPICHIKYKVSKIPIRKFFSQYHYELTEQYEDFKIHECPSCKHVFDRFGKIVK